MPRTDIFSLNCLKGPKIGRDSKFCGKISSLLSISICTWSDTSNLCIFRHEFEQIFAPLLIALYKMNYIGHCDTLRVRQINPANRENHKRMNDGANLLLAIVIKNKLFARTELSQSSFLFVTTTWADRSQTWCENGPYYIRYIYNIIFAVPANRDNNNNPSDSAFGCGDEWNFAIRETFLIHHQVKNYYFIKLDVYVWIVGSYRHRTIQPNSISRSLFYFR